MNGLKKAAVLAVLAMLAVVALYIANPQLLNGGSDHTFKTPKGDYVVRLDTDGNPTAFVPDGEAQQNHLKLVVTFSNGAQKTCNGNCPIDGTITKVQATKDGKVIATWS